MSLEPEIKVNAIIRYCRRVNRTDLNKVEAEILSAFTRKAILQRGDGKYFVDGYRLIVRDGTIIHVT